MTTKDRRSMKVEKDGWVASRFPKFIAGEYCIVVQHFSGGTGDRIMFVSLNKLVLRC